MSVTQNGYTEMSRLMQGIEFDDGTVLACSGATQNNLSTSLLLMNFIFKTREESSGETNGVNISTNFREEFLYKNGEIIITSYSIGDSSRLQVYKFGAAAAKKFRLHKLY